MFAYLAEHENLETIFAPVKITRLRDGNDGTRNGAGSARRLFIGVLPSIDETNTKVVANELIEYAITRGGPLRQHWGRIEFAPLPADSTGTHRGSRVIYTLGFNAKIPGLARLVGFALAKKIKDGLRRVQRFA